MYMSFLDQHYKSITPLVLDEYRTNASGTLNNLVQPPFNNQLPEEEYKLFTAGKSDLLPSIKAQFESYLEYSFDKLSNWQALRDAYQTHRLAVMVHEHSEPENVWYCQHLEEGTMETYTPPTQPVEVESAVTVAEQLDSMTLSQAIEFVKQKAQSFAVATATQQQLQAYKEELTQLEERRAHLVQTIAEFEQHEFPTTEEFDAIAELAQSLKQLFN
jgi:C4-dicarboxylate-specific signal transduction histidine kinase